MESKFSNSAKKNLANAYTMAQQQANIISHAEGIISKMNKLAYQATDPISTNLDREILNIEFQDLSKTLESLMFDRTFNKQLLDPQAADYVDKTVAEKIKTFTHLETFVQMIKEFRSPIRFYSNKQLTTLFNDTGKNIQPFMEFIEFLRKIVIEDKPEDKLLSNTTMIDNLKTGVMSVREKINDSKKDEKIDPLKQQTKLYYDCFVNFELIEGLLNDDVVELIECPYRNNFLGTIYNDLKTSENKNPMLFYNNIPVFDMAKYTQKNRSTKGSKKIKGGFNFQVGNNSNANI